MLLEKKIKQIVGAASKACCSHYYKPPINETQPQRQYVPLASLFILSTFFSFTLLFLFFLVKVCTLKYD